MKDSKKNLKYYDALLELLYRSKLTPRQTALLCFIFRKTIAWHNYDFKGWSINTLAHAVGIHRQHATKALHDLVEMGLLIRQRTHDKRGACSKSLYKIDIHRLGTEAVSRLGTEAVSTCGKPTEEGLGTEAVSRLGTEAVSTSTKPSVLNHDDLNQSDKIKALQSDLIESLTKKSLFKPEEIEQVHSVLMKKIGHGKDTEHVRAELKRIILAAGARHVKNHYDFALKCAHNAGNKNGGS